METPTGLTSAEYQAIVEDAAIDARANNIATLTTVVMISVFVLLSFKLNRKT